VDWNAFSHSSTFTFLVIPVLIFFARIFDVSLDTMRVIFVTKGFRWLAPMCGFIQVLIWLVAITQIMKNLNNVLCYIAYAGGFAAGNFIGMYIERKMALGVALIRIITRNEALELLHYLKANNYGVTAIDGEGLFGKVKVIFTIIKRADIDDVLASIKKYNPQAFYTIEDVRSVSEAAYSPAGNNSRKHSFFKGIRLIK
jgi:uncharacterized protein YebE (UPF0316 family)